MTRYVIMNDNLVRPEFSMNGPIAIKEGRHSVVEQEPSMGTFIANNTYISRDLCLNIITGPNHSGKSTYLLQVAIMTILAHLGCYVPATYASFRLTDQLFALVVMEDDIESSSSTFMSEMRQLSFILQNANSKSLVIIDELGRGTSNIEGLSLCWATCEELVQKGSYTLIATHFLKLTRLPEYYKSMSNVHFKVSPKNDKVVAFKHELGSGPSAEIDQQYGIYIAQLAGFPERIIKLAKKLYCKLKKKQEIERLNSATPAANNKHELLRCLLACKHSTHTEQAMFNHLQELYRTHVSSSSATRS